MNLPMMVAVPVSESLMLMPVAGEKSRLTEQVKVWFPTSVESRESMLILLEPNCRLPVKNSVGMT